MLKKPSKDEYSFDGETARHVPTGIEITFPYPDQAGCNRSITYRRGDAGDYAEAEVVKIGAELLHIEGPRWNCPLCGGVFYREDRAAIVKEYEERCRLKEHSVGYECLALRQEDRARQLLVEKLEDEVRRLESGSVRVVEAGGGERMADVSRSRIGKLRAEIARIKAA